MVGNALPVEKKPVVKAFNCPSCGASLNIRAVGQTLVVACTTCDAIIDVTNENYKILQRYEKTRNILPTIPLGSRGKIRGDLFEVIGFMRRSDSTGEYSWSEYLLFNPFKGFRWLMEAYGHWNFISMTRNKPSVIGQTAVFLSEKYKLFYEGFSRVTYVMGEFYWRVKVGSSAQVRDFISPPRVLSEEKDADEIMWSIGEYVEREEIARAFDIKTPLPMQTGVAPNQPSPHSTASAKLMPYFLLFMGALMLIQFFTIALAKSKELHRQTFKYDPNIPGQVFTTEKFEQPAWRSNLEIDLSSPVENNWLAADIALVNEKTGKAYYFDQGVEYYHGYDGGEHWSEGNTRSDVLISSVPKGTYYLTLEPTSGGVPSGTFVEVVVRRDVVLWWNACWAFPLIMILPAFAFTRKHAFEMRRWADSDFSPYQTKESE